LGNSLDFKSLKLITTGFAAVTGIIALLIGVVALKWYLWDIVFQQAGESDRSMLFWGIPIALIGLASTALGAALMMFVRHRTSRPTSVS
jgi:hypothetical protein